MLGKTYHCEWQVDGLINSTNMMNAFIFQSLQSSTNQISYYLQVTKSLRIITVKNETYSSVMFINVSKRYVVCALKRGMVVRTC